MVIKLVLSFYERCYYNVRFHVMNDLSSYMAVRLHIRVATNEMFVQPLIIGCTVLV